MKKVNKFNAGMALGSLTAVVALLAGAPVARADDSTLSVGNTAASDSGQAAPGGGSFPGSFLVPGTNTSIKIGGFAKGVYIYDMSAADGAGVDSDVEAAGAIPLDGNATHSLHGATRLHARQSNVSFDVRTPTSYGELDTFILIDFFGQNTAQAQAGANTQNARLVLAYGTLGPLLAGQFLSNWFDGDALGESVDPTVTIGVSNGLTNRQPQFRYTYAGANGLSISGSVEEPVWEYTDNAAGNVTTANAADAISRYPDFIARARLDQAWGHVSLAGLVHDQEVYQLGTPRFGGTGWGAMLSGHLNVFGKDTLRAEGMFGKALGHYLSDMGSIAGLQTNLAVDAVRLPYTYGANVSYTHWWTDQLRSTVIGGYSHVENTGVFTNLATANTVDNHHIGGTINLVWSPVPQVDLGIEYDWASRVTDSATAFISNQGNLNRVEAEAVFKF